MLQKEADLRDSLPWAGMLGEWGEGGKKQGKKGPETWILVRQQRDWKGQARDRGHGSSGNSQSNPQAKGSKAES